ncbi:Sensor_kinase_SpoOB-type, alpha-helical domain [Anaerocolumna xylanovorans DSM 12503]|uniref:Sensor_kinase_SpoOB-type, alpha-helical domain n=2 Tax=Anaerocolumna TaxID=1843210 RepID=A0A1M7YKD1_9FIRM|nr:Sensor_kinase_SpoOB-type, alpha-helical domain [Anaerocolumna xylanovorans DSM 12503]
MNNHFISLCIDITYNLLTFLVFNKYCDFFLIHKNQDKLYAKRLYFYVPIQILFSTLSMDATIFFIILALSYLTYVKIFYIIAIKKCFIFTFKFFILFYGLMWIAFIIITVIMDFLSGALNLLDNNFYQNLKGILLNSITYIIFCFFLHYKKLKKQPINNPYKVYVYLILGLIILALSAFIIYVYTLNSSQETLENMVMIIFLINILLIVLILSIYEKIVDSLQEAALKQLQQQKYELTQSYYDELSEKSTQLMSLRHDFKNHLGIIAGRLEQKDYSEALTYLEKITDATKSAGDLVITNNATISAILQSKKVECERKGIRFTYTAAFEKIYKLTDMDFTIMLGNILDNAIEALEAKIADKYLTVSIAQAGTYLVIQCENPYLAKPLKKNGYLVTSKKDKEFHGIGLLNVSEVCEKYNGEFHYTYDNSIFKVKILLPNY